MSATRVALRIATRDVRRNLGRSSLIVALIAFPVTALTVAILSLTGSVPPRSPSSSGPIAPGAESGVLVILAVFVVLLVCLLAGAAFFVGAKSQQRALATIGSVGGKRSSLIAIVSLAGPILGGLGGLLGIALGLAVLVLGALLGGGDLAHLTVAWSALVGIFGFTVILGWVAAVIPALPATRLDIVAAVRGINRPRRPRRAHRVVALTLLALGVALQIFSGVVAVATWNDVGPWAVRLMPWSGLVFLAGAVCTIAGGILSTEMALTATALLAAKSGPALRIATRDMLRNRGRSIPVIAVITGATFITALMMIVTATSQETGRVTYPYQTIQDQEQLALAPYPGDGGTTLGPSLSPFADADIVAQQASAAYRVALPVDSLAVLRTVVSPAGIGARIPSENTCRQLLPLGQRSSYPLSADPNCRDRYAVDPVEGSIPAAVLVGDISDLAVILGREPSLSAEKALANGGAVSLHRAFTAEDGVITLSRPGNGADIRLPGTTVEPTHPVPFGIIISPATATRFGLESRPTQLLATTYREPTQAEFDALGSRLDAIPMASNLMPTREAGPPDGRGWAWGLFGICAIFVVGAAAVSLALARFEARNDTRVLFTLGAPPPLQRSISAWQALTLTATGTILGTAAAVLGGYALHPSGSGAVFAAPWLPLLAIAVGLPILIGGGVWLYRRTVSSM